MSTRLRVCRNDELGEGDTIVVEHEAEQILVLKHGGKVYAISNICTHDYAELEHGIVIDKTITCPVHLSRFRLETGEVLNPPATKPIKTYKVHIFDEEIFVEV